MRMRSNLGRIKIYVIQSHLWWSYIKEKIVWATKHIKILKADDDIAMGHLLLPFSEILYSSFDFY